MDAVSLIVREAGLIGRRAKKLLDGGNVLYLFQQLGLQLDAATYGGSNYASLRTNLAGAIASVQVLIQDAQAVQDLVSGATAPDPEQLLALASSLYQAIADLFAQLTAIKTALAAVQAAATGPSQQELTDFAQQFLDLITPFLLISHLESFHRSLLAVLVLLGIVSDRTVQPLAATTLPSPSKTLSLHNLSALLRNPYAHLKAFYGWDTPNFAARSFLLNLRGVLDALGLAVYFEPHPYNLAAVPVLHLNSFLALSPAADSTYAFDVVLTAPALNKTLLLPISLAGWEFEVSANCNLEAGSAFKINWDGTIQANLANLTAEVGLSVTARLPKRAAGPDYTLLTTPFGTGLTASAVELKATFTTPAATAVGTLSGEGEMAFSLAFTGLGLNVAPGNTDSFIGQLLGGERQKVKSDVALDWTKAGGLAVRGGKGLLPKKKVNLKLGPLQVLDLALGLDPQNDATRVVGTFGATAQVGPVRATAEEMGFAATLSYAPGNLGPFGLGLAFQGPSGVGIAVESDLLKGGGYLFLDPAHHKYAGAATLKLALGKQDINLNALGLLQTELPGRPDAYSLLLLITATFTPIELGLGFTLNGLGGLLGLHRAADTAYLRGLVRQGQLDKLLFPANVMANPADALATVDAAFPATEGRYLIGLMGELGWGVPTTLIALDVALLVELPAPVRLLILGVLHASLPSKTNELLKLRADFLGSIDFGAKKVAFDASLSESKLLVYTLTGDMAFRLYQGDNPVFLLSAGGFHPQFQPPAGADLPPLRRLTLALAQGNDLRLTLASYFAVTSNTVQFGAHLDLYLNLRLGLHVEGHLGLDTLFQFNPFHLLAHLDAGVAIKRGDSELLGLNLSLAVSGPGPWHVWGEASFKIWFVKISVDVNYSTHEGTTNPTLPAPDVRTPLVAALHSAAAWAVVAPAAAVPGGVVLRPPNVAAGQLFLDPRGTLVLSQRVAPLGLTLGRYGTGTAAPTGGNRFELRSITVKSSPTATPHVYAATDAAHVEVVRDFFAPDQFLALSIDERLSLPSFQLQPNGLRLKGLSHLTAGSQPKATRRIVQYERRLRAGAGGSGALATLPGARPGAPAFGKLARGGALGQAVQAAQPSARAAQPVGWAETTYAVVQAADLTVYQQQDKIGSQAEAEQYRQAQPTAADLLVVPTYQLALA